MSAHVAFIRPSSAHTWIVCHGQPGMRALYPEIPDEADDEVREDGTACHWLAAELFHKRHHAEGTLAPNGRVLTDEMFEACDLYLDTIKAWPANCERYVEQPVDTSYILPGTSGTPDVWAFDPATYTLYLADLKFGFRFVEVWWNWQLIMYAAALIHLLQLDDLRLRIVFQVVQPRSSHRDGPVRTWTVKAHTIRPAVNQLQYAAAKASEPGALCVPNPGCNDCPARHACVALQNSALTAIEQSYAGVPLELGPVAAGDELRRLKEAAKRLDARVTGLEGQVEGMLRAGQSVPHWGLKGTYARERWQEGAEAQVLTIARYFNVDVSKPLQPISPAQARKLLPEGIVAMFAHKPSTGVKLTRTDPHEAEKAFGR